MRERLSLREMLCDAQRRYAATAWRAAPQHRGGFVLDGGIHFVALLRAVQGPFPAVLLQHFVCERIPRCIFVTSCTGFGRRRKGRAQHVRAAVCAPAKKKCNTLGSYTEHNACEVGACGACSVASAPGTFLIRYGAFPAAVCRLDV